MIDIEKEEQEKQLDLKTSAVFTDKSNSYFIIVVAILISALMYNSFGLSITLSSLGLIILLPFVTPDRGMVIVVFICRITHSFNLFTKSPFSLTFHEYLAEIMNRLTIWSSTRKR